MGFKIEDGVLWKYEDCGETEVIIPNDVTAIGYGAFKECRSLKSVVIHDNMTKIGWGAFRECKSLENAIISEGVAEIGDSAFEGCTSLTSVKIPDGVKEIGCRAFRYCEKLKSVTIPDSVKEIGGEAFYYCKNLTSVTIPESVTEIGLCAFEGTPWLKNLCKNNNGFAIVGHILVKYRGNNTDVIIPEGVTIIVDNVFSGCTRFRSVKIPDSVTKIGNSAFRGCTSLTSVTIPDSVTEIGAQAFQSCTSLRSIIIPDSFTVIGENVFEGTPWFENLCENNDGFAIVNHILLRYAEQNGTTNVIIPEGVTEIGDGAFSGCKSLKSITIPNGIAQIEKNYYGGAFSGCTSLEKIVTPDFEIKIHAEEGLYEQIRIIALKDLSIKFPHKIKYNLIWQMFFQKPDDEDVFAYVKKNFSKMLKFAIDNNDVDLISEICKTKGLFTKRNIDKLIEYAIQHTQNGGTVEIQALLMRYKNENIGFSTPSFRI